MILNSNKKRILAIIGARKGSKGLPGKNTLLCGGKPLIYWTIQAARNAECVTTVLVTSDSSEVVDISNQFNDVVTLERPLHLATDECTTDAVIQHVLSDDSVKRSKYDYVLWLQPTSPLRNSVHIDNAIGHYFENVHDLEETLVSVSSAPRKTYWVLSSNDNRLVDFQFDVNPNNLRRQDLPALYMPNGAIYLSPVQSYTSFYNNKTQFFLMSDEDSVDIDYAEDLDRASQILLSREDKNY